MPATAIKRHTELYEAVYGASLKDEAPWHTAAIEFLLAKRTEVA